MIQSIPEAEEELIKPTVTYQNGPSEEDEVLKLVNPQDTARLLSEEDNAVSSRGINGIINGDQRVLVNGDAHRT